MFVLTEHSTLWDSHSPSTANVPKRDHTSHIFYSSIKLDKDTADVAHSRQSRLRYKNTYSLNHSANISPRRSPVHATPTTSLISVSLGHQSQSCGHFIGSRHTRSKFCTDASATLSAKSTKIIKFNIVPLAPLGRIQDVQQTKSNHLIPRNSSAEQTLSTLRPVSRKLKQTKKPLVTGRGLIWVWLRSVQNPHIYPISLQISISRRRISQRSWDLKNEIDIGDPDRAMSIKTVANPNLTMSVTCGTIRI
jgi:hypothetical protein